MHYRGHNIVMVNHDTPNLISIIKPRMVVTFINEYGGWQALAYNDQGYIVEGKADNQSVAVDIAINKAHVNITMFAGLPVEKDTGSAKTNEIIYWHQGEKLDSDHLYYAELKIIVNESVTTLSGNGLVLENALEHVALKLRGIFSN